MVCMLLLLAIMVGTLFNGTSLLFMMVNPPWEREFNRF